MKISILLCLTLAACASSPSPPPATAVAVSADNGQPKMQAALAALQHARAEVEAAEANKGGHRATALGLIQQAIISVNEGMQWAAAHPTEIGPIEGPAANEPVDQVVPGGGGQPRMAQGIVDLREARRQLREAKADKGGYRVRALQLIQQAITQLFEGIQFANTH
jgi:hypothetical protein